MSKIKAIIFDFDGVIAESVNVKTEAFAEMYRPYGKGIEDKVVRHHEANGGMSRFEKFVVYHENFLNENINQEKINELAKQFSKLVLDKVVEAPYVDGAYNFLSEKYNDFDFFISTGTPEDEINIILKRRSLKSFFKGIYGSPSKKEVHVKNILEEAGYKKSEVVFVGDAISDRNAAKRNGIKFIGRYTTTEEIKKEEYLFDNFVELEKIIREL